MTAPHPDILWRNGFRTARVPMLAAIALGVIAMHAWVLLGWAPGRPDAAGRPPALQVRQIAPAAEDGTADAQRPPPTAAAGAAEPSVMPAASDGPAADAGPAPRPPGNGRFIAAAPVRAPAPLDAPAAAPAATPAAAPPAAAASPAGPDTARPAAASAHASARPDFASDVAPAVVPALAPAPDGADPVPLYPTQLPPPAALRFEMHRGTALGSATLQWRREGARYAIELAGTLGGTEVLGRSSRGGFDAAGLAPERFVVRRRGRDWQAANFQRGGGAAGPGRITFSGPAVESPLAGGAQDRLSWIVQLAAIVQADPARAAPGAQVHLWVVGTRADAEVWTFEAQPSRATDAPSAAPASPANSAAPAPAAAAADLADPADPVLGRATRLVRSPRHNHDVRVEIWLDPARHHLPLRLRYTPWPGGERLELRLRELQWLPSS